MAELSGHTILEVEGVILLLLIVALGVAWAAKRLRLPYTVGLVLVGLFITPVLHLEVVPPPELILGLLVPPLIFEAAFHIRIDDLRRDVRMIGVLAILGVIVTTFLVGWMVHAWAGIALEIALLFGALIAATDPVAVVALFKQLGVPKRLQVLLEGESLFNDGTAIVMFGVMLDIALTGEVNVMSSIGSFIWVAGGGLLTGWLLGMLASQFIGNIDDALMETTITTTLAFGAYLIGEAIGVSGVLAVVVAGIVNGNISPRGMSPTTKIVVNNFWEYISFLANSIIFLLIGLTINLQILSENLGAIFIAIVAVLVARAVGIYGFSAFSKDIQTPWKHVLYWGGLRGAIVLALALSIPRSLAGAETVLAMSFGVVLFTLLVQGFSMEKLVKQLHLIRRSNIQEKYERRHARFVANRAAADHLEKMSKQGLLSSHIWAQMSPLFQEREAVHMNALKDMLTANPAVEIEELDAARREALRVERSALGSLYRDGVISEEVYGDLAREIDEAITESHVNWLKLLQLGDGKRAEVTKIMTVIIQEDDLQSAIKGLQRAGFGVDQLPSTGGFLSRRNLTLLIGIPEGREKDVVNTLDRYCHRRVEHVRTPFVEGGFLPQRAEPIEVGGATIFTFKVEAYHEF